MEYRRELFDAEHFTLVTCIDGFLSFCRQVVTKTIEDPYEIQNGSQNQKSKPFCLTSRSTTVISRPLNGQFKVFVSGSLQVTELRWNFGKVRWSLWSELDHDFLKVT